MAAGEISGNSTFGSGDAKGAVPQRIQYRLGVDTLSPECL